jgi:hypothetical protein
MFVPFLFFLSNFLFKKVRKLSFNRLALVLMVHFKRIQNLIIYAPRFIR